MADWCTIEARLMWHMQTCITSLFKRSVDMDGIAAAMCHPIRDCCVIKFARAITALELMQKREHYSVFIPGIDAYQ